MLDTNCVQIVQQKSAQILQQPYGCKCDQPGITVLLYISFPQETCRAMGFLKWTASICAYFTLYYGL